jgi:hypothetical protein
MELYRTKNKSNNELTTEEHYEAHTGSTMSAIELQIYQ